jgi:hypothetical protein
MVRDQGRTVLRPLGNLNSLSLMNACWHTKNGQVVLWSSPEEQTKFGGPVHQFAAKKFNWRPVTPT